jgi:hypothetical protein
MRALEAQHDTHVAIARHSPSPHSASDALGSHRDPYTSLGEFTHRECRTAPPNWTFPASVDSSTLRKHDLLFPSDEIALANGHDT